MKTVGAKLTAFVHATEDAGKVSRAMDQVCPSLIFEQKSEIRKFRGHYGNEIIIMTVSVRKRSAEPFMRHLMRLLKAQEVALLVRDLRNRVDEEGHLHLRLDKQESLRGSFHLHDADPIKCELSFEIGKADHSTLIDRIGQYLSSLIEQA